LNRKISNRQVQSIEKIIPNIKLGFFFNLVELGMKVNVNGPPN
jgi:hypothetical protein